MGIIQSWQKSPAVPGSVAALERGVSEAPGFLEHSRDFLLGSKSAAWLKDNQEKMFPLVERSQEQLKELQSSLGEMLSDYRRGILPQVTKQTADGEIEADMPPLQFLERVTGLMTDQVAVLEKIVGVMNKVASGGTNILTAALLGSNALTFQAQRRERQAKPGRKVGVDALPEGVIDV